MTGIGAGTDNQGHGFVGVNFEGEGWGRAERGHDILVANYEGKGKGQAERGHDIVVEDDGSLLYLLAFHPAEVNVKLPCVLNSLLLQRAGL